METELKRDQISLWTEVGQESTQLLLEGDVVVPDSKPDVEQILYTAGAVRWDNPTASEGKVRLKGNLDTKILYRTKKSSWPVAVMESSLPIEETIYMDGVTSSSRIHLESVLEHLESEWINDRKVGLRAVAAVEVTAEERKETDVMEGSEDDGIVWQKVEIVLEKRSDGTEKEDRFTVEDTLVLPQMKPNVGEILMSEGTISDLEVRPGENKITVRGNLKTEILYQPEEENSMPESVTFRLPFHGVTEMDGVTGQSQVETDASLDSLTVEAEMDETGALRNIHIKGQVGLDFTVHDEETRVVVEDGYDPKRESENEKTTLTYYRTPSVCTGEEVHRGTLTLPQDVPAVLQVQAFFAEAVLQEARAEEGKIILEGRIKYFLLYLCENDAEPIASYTSEFPFTQVLLCREAKEGDRAHAHLITEDAQIQMMSDREGEMSVTVGAQAAISRMEETEVLSNMTLGEESIRMPAAAVIYVVKEGDSLWSIGKKFGLPLETILEYNDIQTPDMIYPGEKILLFRSR